MRNGKEGSGAATLDSLTQTLHDKVYVLFQQPSIVKRDDREGAVNQAVGRAWFAKIMEDLSND
jgi:hypothetical protein